MLSSTWFGEVGLGVILGDEVFGVGVFTVVESLEVFGGDSDEVFGGGKARSMKILDFRSG